MASIDSSSLLARRHFLDVAPMISALQFQPTDFELSRGWLNHVPSRHRFKFDKTGGVMIDARCGCAVQSVSAEQGNQLFRAFTSWRQYYWQPLQVDREFASHFEKPNAWVRFFRDVRMAWRRRRGYADPVTLPIEALAAVAAE